MDCGKTSGTDAVLYRYRDGDRDADCRKRDSGDRGRLVPVVRISYVLQIKNSPRSSEGNF